MNDEFIKTPIYYKRSWPVEKNSENYYINAENTKNILDFFRNGNTKLKTYCVACKDDESFTSDSQLYKKYCGLKNNNYVYKIEYNNFELFEAYEVYKEGILYINESYVGKSYLQKETLTCNLDNHHQYVIYYMLSYNENEFIITKIGQNISPYEIGLPEAKTYEKQLKKFNTVEDYRKVFIHRINNDNVAALLYLRRILEKMVIKLLDGAELLDNHFETKIKKIKENNKLNPEVNELTKSVYELLSKGIHELSNDECTELFDSLNLFIDMQLIYIKTEEEKKQRLLKLKNDICEKNVKYK